MKVAFLLGIVLLIVTFIGVQLVLEHHSSQATNETTVEEINKLPSNVVCLGHFDVEPGVAGLYPKQAGDILSLAEENTVVKKGDVLLQVDDVMAQLKVEEAQADVQASDQQMAEARLLESQYRLQREQQQYAINALGHEITKVERERDTKLEQVEKGHPLKKTITQFYEESLAQLNEKMKSEQSKLKQLELLNAQLKIDLVQADRNAKMVRVKQAKDMLKFFQIVAPSDGTVLRVYVRKGETLGPNPKMHAIDFMPDAPIIVRAEVLQEWGRLIREGQEVEIQDDTYNGPTWKGHVKTISKWYAPTRSPVIEPFRFNDVRTLECIVGLDKGGATKFIGQRIRAKVKIDPDLEKAS